MGSVVALPPALGRHTKSAATLPVRDLRGERFALQKAAAELLPGWRVGWCLRYIKPDAPAVRVRWSPGRRRASYADLEVCGSVWVCPVCAAKIAERRREELTHAVNAHREAGGVVLAAAFTFRHTRFDNLDKMRRAFQDAMRSMCADRAYKTLLRRSGVVGSVRALEVTWGQAAGWHPHAHVLYFAGAGVDAVAFQAELLAVWRRVAARFGLTMNEHGLRVQATWGAVEDYIAKYGQERYDAVYGQDRRPWGIEDELAKANVKRGRSVGDKAHYTPFELLGRYLAGDECAGLRFTEFAESFKGRRQLFWSPGLRDVLGLAAELDDRAVVESSYSDDEDVAALELPDWRVVLACDARAELLALVERSSDEPGARHAAVVGFVSDLYRRYWGRGAAGVSLRPPVELPPQDDIGPVFNEDAGLWWF